jgi:hypothetical protein
LRRIEKHQGIVGEDDKIYEAQYDDFSAVDETSQPMKRFLECESGLYLPINCIVYHTPVLGRFRITAAL